MVAPDKILENAQLRHNGPCLRCSFYSFRWQRNVSEITLIRGLQQSRIKLIMIVTRLIPHVYKFSWLVWIVT